MESPKKNQSIKQSEEISTFGLGGTTIKKLSLAPNVKSGQVISLSNFLWAKLAILNHNIQQTTPSLPSSSQKKMGLCGVFLGKMSSKCKQCRSAVNAESKFYWPLCIIFFLTGKTANVLENKSYLFY